MESTEVSEYRGPFPVTRALIEAQVSSAAAARASDEMPPPPPIGEWAPDILGRGHEAQTLPLGTDDEGDVVATLVRYRVELDEGFGTTPGARPDADEGRDLPAPRFAVLYLHGWSDYLLNHEIGPFWARHGGVFYGLDLRKYGRSLRVGQTPGFITDLDTYDEDLAAALAIIEREHPDLPLVIMAHSTGGLTAALWADRHPGRVAGLVLVAPWLELQGSTLARLVGMAFIPEVARLFPKRRVLNPDLGYYDRSINKLRGGEWDLVAPWRPEHSFPATHAWASAILHGHTAVASGLDVACPVLVLRSAHSIIQTAWSERMREQDAVLDVDVIAQRALRIASDVTVATVEGALHDVLLSREPVREDAYARIARWARAYLP